VAAAGRAFKKAAKLVQVLDHHRFGLPFFFCGIISHIKCASGFVSAYMLFPTVMSNQQRFAVPGLPTAAKHHAGGPLVRQRFHSHSSCRGSAGNCFLIARFRTHRLTSHQHPQCRFRRVGTPPLRLFLHQDTCRIQRGDTRRPIIGSPGNRGSWICIRISHRDSNGRKSCHPRAQAFNQSLVSLSLPSP